MNSSNFSQFEQTDMEKQPDEPSNSTVGELPSQYKRMSAAREPSNSQSSKIVYFIVPIIVASCLLWMAHVQWKSSSKVEQFHKNVEEIENQEKIRIEGVHDLKETLQPFADGYRTDNFIPKHNLAICEIKGNFPELNAAICCYLHNPSLFTAANKTISQDLVENGLCSKEDSFRMTTWDKWTKYVTDKVCHVAIIQHPLERFSRSFVEICIKQKACYNCQDNVDCFMKKLLREHSPLAEGLEGNYRTYVTHHFSPQTWNCHFNRDLNKIQFLKFGGSKEDLAKFLTDLDKILGEQGVEADVRSVITNEINKIPLELTPEEQVVKDNIRNNEDLFRLFRNLYEHDYILFGYSL